MRGGEGRIQVSCRTLISERVDLVVIDFVRIDLVTASHL